MQQYVLLTQARLSPRVHGSSGQKAIRKFNIVGVREKKSGQRRRKSGGGASEPSPGGRFPRSPLAEVGHRRPFFRPHVVVLLCGWDVAAPRGRRRPSGVELGSRSFFWGGCYNQDIFKDPKKNTTTTLAYYIIRISTFRENVFRMTAPESLPILTSSKFVPKKAFQSQRRLTY